MTHLQEDPSFKYRWDVKEVFLAALHNGAGLYKAIGPFNVQGLKGQHQQFKLNLETPVISGAVVTTVTWAYQAVKAPHLDILDHHRHIWCL